jgi:uracil-DNA glycosylase family 4
MALHKSMLEEFGLGTVWVRRSTTPREVSEPVASDQPAAAPLNRVAAAEPQRLASRELDVSSVAKPDSSNTLNALDAVLSAAIKTRDDAWQAPPVTEPIAERSPVKARPAHINTPSKADAIEPPVFDDLPWLDDIPAQSAVVPDTIDETAADIASLDWDALSGRVSACERCRLCERRTNAVFGVGDREADWMLIGEAPGENEDKLGEPFVGQAGKLLDSMLHAVALSREDNVFIANVIKCRPPGNRNPEPDEVARCEPYLKRQVELVKPKLIVALGRFAAQSLLKTEASIASLRGRVHEYQGVPVIVTYHPAYLLRSLPDKAKSWADLCLAQATYRESLKAANGT